MPVQQHWRNATTFCLYVCREIRIRHPSASTKSRTIVSATESLGTAPISACCACGNHARRITVIREVILFFISSMAVCTLVSSG
jgi:hypothetical protein